MNWWQFEGVAEESNQDNADMKNVTDKEISAFHARFCPFADRLYRSALIVTGNPKSAEQLQVDVYLKAFVEYLHAGHLANFETWLAEIAGECFADYEIQDNENFSITSACHRFPIAQEFAEYHQMLCAG